MIKLTEVRMNLSLTKAVAMCSGVLDLENPGNFHGGGRI